MKGESQIEVIEEIRLKDVKLNKSKLSNVLWNPVYKGVIRVPQSEEESEQLVEGQHERLVTDVLFDKVNEIIEKRHIISSIFPEKLVFDGNKCRTPRMNKVLYQILLIDNNLEKYRSGQCGSRTCDLYPVKVAL